MKLSSDSLRLRRALYLIEALALVLLYAAYSFLLSPLYAAAVSNVAVADTVLPELLYYLSRIVELLAISVSYAVMIFGIWKFSLSQIALSPVIFILATLFKYGANLAVSWIIAGGVSEIWVWDLVNLLFYTALEAIQLAIVLIAVNSVLKKQKKRDRLLAGTGKESVVYPFRGLYDKSNCLMRSAMLSAVIVFVSKILGVLINDVYAILSAGLPQEGSTVILMLVNYLSNLIFGVICYIAVIFTVMKLVEKNQN